MSIDASLVVAQFGAHYINEGQNMDRIKKLLYTASRTAALFMDRPMEGNYFKSTNARMSSVLQPFQKKFTPKGTLTFKPNAFPLFHPKIDVSIYPDDIQSSYLGFLGSVEIKERANWPLVRYMLEEHLLMAREDEMENTVSFKGKFVDPTPDVASPAAETMDGIREVLKKYVAGGRINLSDGPLAMGALASSDEDFCVQIEEWVDAMDPTLRMMIDIIVMSDTLARKYARGKRKKYGLQTAFLSGMGVNDLRTVEDYSMIMVEGVLSMEGSTVIWATPKTNRIRPIWKNQKPNLFKVEEQKREVSIMTDWWEALEFEVPEFIIVNDSADLVS